MAKRVLGWLGRQTGLTNLGRRLEAGRIERDAYWTERTKKENVEMLAKKQVAAEFERRTQKVVRPKLRYAAPARGRGRKTPGIGQVAQKTTSMQAFHDIIGYDPTKKEKKFVLP